MVQSLTSRSSMRLGLWPGWKLLSTSPRPVELSPVLSCTAVQCACTWYCSTGQDRGQAASLSQGHAGARARQGKHASSGASVSGVEDLPTRHAHVQHTAC